MLQVFASFCSFPMPITNFCNSFNTLSTFSFHCPFHSHSFPINFHSFTADSFSTHFRSFFTFWTVHVATSPPPRAVNGFPISVRTFQILKIFGKSVFTGRVAKFAMFLWHFTELRCPHVVEVSDIESRAAYKNTTRM